MAPGIRVPQGLPERSCITRVACRGSHAILPAEIHRPLSVEGVPARRKGKPRIQPDVGPIDSMSGCFL